MACSCRHSLFLSSMSRTTNFGGILNNNQHRKFHLTPGSSVIKGHLRKSALVLNSDGQEIQQQRFFDMSKIASSFTSAAERSRTFSTAHEVGRRGQEEVKNKGKEEDDESSSSSSSSSDSDSDEENKEYPSPNDEEYGEFTAKRGQFLNEHMVPLTPLQRAIITVGSGLAAFFDPTKAENIATFGEISAGPVLNRLYKNMLDDPEGYRILTQKPRINSKTVDLDYLATLPKGTLGHAYVKFLEKNNVTPDSRLPVRFIEDPELAYVIQRYREVHDLVHTVTGQPTNMLGEVVVKWIEGIQTGLPMCVTGGLFGATRLYPKQRQRYLDTHLKWAIEVGFTSRPFLYIYYEERWEQSLDELRFYICPKLLNPPKSHVKKKE